MLNPASELLSRRFLPGLRAAVARRLDDRGYDQGEIAELLDCTQPAVSQYLTRKRGRAEQVIQEDGFLRQRVDSITDAVAQGDRERVRELYREACEYVHRENPGRLLGDAETFFDL